MTTTVVSMDPEPLQLTPDGLPECGPQQIDARFEA
jgi:hypothetical protein